MYNERLFSPSVVKTGAFCLGMHYKWMSFIRIEEDTGMFKEVRDLLFFHNNRNYKTHGKIAMQGYIKDEYLDSEGKAKINIKLYEGLDVFDPLSMGKQTDLNPEIIDYIDRKVEIIDANIPVALCFHDSGMIDTDKKKTEECLKEFYSIRMYGIRNDLRTNRKKYVLLALFGVVMLSIYFALDYALGDGLRTEIISIIGSFSLWEAADLFILERRELLSQMRSNLRLLEADVLFIED